MIVFFLLYAFIIYPRLKDKKDNQVVNIYNNISNYLLTTTVKELENGIWDILKKFKSKELDLTIVGFKDYYTVMQHIENLKNIDSFCITYQKTEGCSNPDSIK